MDEATLQAVKFDDLRPTQITLGFWEVELKREQWRKDSPQGRKALLSKHTAPTVIGPKGRHYLIDSHHLARAVQLEGAKAMTVSVVADLSVLPRESFWIYLDNLSWCHPYDDRGVRRGFDAIPKSLDDLVDDPFRGLANALRRAGGFAKDPAPFGEFLWADFLRRRMKRSLVESDFPNALVEALGLARSKDANYLPGWCGPDPA
jgi:hypothetical protein